MDEYGDESLAVAAEDTFAQTPNILYHINQLSPEQAIVIKLKYYQDKTFKEIAGLLQIPINTVMGRYRYGMEKIREILEQQL
jgi:DNA-directed RNA polymerase specialized sigma24 family protein